MKEYELYKGYIPTLNKKSQMSFKGKKPDELLDLESARRLKEYAGILNDNTVLIDLDNQTQSDILYKMIVDLNLNCKIIKTTHGKHFLFHSNVPFVNKTNCKLAIGLKADIKGGGRASYEVLKFDNKEREILYDNPPYQEVPKYLYPIKTSVDIYGLCEGEGRNNALFSYILPLQQNGFTVEECRETIRLINKYVIKDPLSDREIDVILRDGAFELPTFFTSKGQFLFDRFANYLKESENVVKINNRMFIYDNGIYKLGDNNIERAMIKHIPTLNRAKRLEVLSYLDLVVPTVNPDKYTNLIAFNNGVLDVVTMEFHDFSPEYIVTNKIPHNFNPNAKSELLEKTISKLACHDEATENLLYEAVGYNFFRKNELRKSFFLLGSKRNGKSTYLDMIQTLLGEENVSNLDLAEIGDRFRTAELTDKLANIGDDISDDWISNTSVFKKVVSGDVITVEKKGKDPYKLHSYAKFFFSANAIPRLGKGRDSQAVLDRLVVISFDATFSKDDPDFDPFIKYKLRDEEVMEALIVKGIEGLRRILTDNAFTVTEKGKVLISDYEHLNNPITTFLEELEDTRLLHQPIKDVYRLYTLFCSENSYQALSALEFQRQVKEIKNVNIRTIEFNGKRTKVYDY